jgi:hypothetical protein
MFYVLLIEVLIILGFDNNILPELLQFITVFCWPVLFFVFMIDPPLFGASSRELRAIDFNSGYFRNILQ